MDCLEFRGWVEDFAAEEVEGDAAELRAHADACPACATSLAEAVELNTRLRAVRANFATDPRLKDRIRRALLKAPNNNVEVIRPSAFWARSRRPLMAAAAALFMVAVAAFFLIGPGDAVPPVIADTLTTYGDLAAGRIPVEIETSDPRRLEEHFRKRLDLQLAAPAEVRGGTYALVGGCTCEKSGSAVRTPLAVYRRGESLMALLSVPRSEADPAMFERAADRMVKPGMMYLFERKGVSVLACFCMDAVHLWVARLPAAELLDAVRAVPDAASAPGGVRLSVEEMNCAMCCAGAREAVMRIPGVRGVAVDPVRGEVRVVLDREDVPTQALTEALGSAGYRAKLLQEKR